MKKYLFSLMLLIFFMTLVGCEKEPEITELVLVKGPAAFVKLNDEVDASQILVNLKVKGKEHNNLPITDEKLKVTGLVNGKLDTSSVGEKTLTITYDNEVIKLKYIVADFLVKTFAELEAALSQSKSFIVLMDNIFVSNTGTGITINKEQEIILELNGHTMSFTPDLSGTTELIKNYGKLTIQDYSDTKKDGTGNGVITNKALSPDTSWSDENPEHPFPFYANNTITNMGTLIIESGRIENTTEGGAAYAIDNNSGTSEANVTINGGQIIGTKNFAIRMFANSATHNNVVNVTGGVIEGTRAIWLQLPGSSGVEKRAKINVTDGLLRSIDSQYNLAIYSYTHGDSFAKTKISITGGTFEGDVGLTGGSLKTPTETVTVTGGYFKGKNGIYSYGTMSPFIMGGTFKADPSEYVDLETYTVEAVDGEYIVSKK